MKKGLKAFTLSSGGILDRLITDCYVREAIDVKEEKNIDLNGDIAYKALWDTGANVSMIDERVARELNLIPYRVGKIYHANGSDDANYYKVSIFLPNRTVHPNQSVPGGNLKGCDVLIGMDIISQGDFSLTNKDGKTVFSFQTPSTHKIDFVEEIKLNDKYGAIFNERSKHGNYKCPCGSGKLYKNCHGKE